MLPDVKIHVLNYFDTGKLVEKKMPEYLLIELLRNAMKICQRIQDIGQTKVRQELKMAPALVSKQVDRRSVTRWWSKEKDSIIFLKPDDPGRLLVPSSNSRSFRKSSFWKCSYRSCIARQCTVTRRFHRVCLSRRKGKRIEVKSELWFDSRRSQSQNRQICCILHRRGSDG